MCIDPPRPRLVPSSLPISSANIPSGSSPLARQWPWPAVGRGDDVVGMQRPAGADRRRLLSDREVHEAGDLAGRGRASRPALRSHGSAASGGASRRGRARRTQAGRGGRRSRSVYCTGRYNKEEPERAMTDQIEIPASFPDPGAVTGKRVVITGASRGLGALLAHAFSGRRRVGGARGPHREGPEGGRRGAARPDPGAQRRRDRRGLQRGGGRRHGRPSGAASTCGSATRGSRRSWPGPARPTPSVWRQVLEVNLTGAFLGARAAARVMGEGGRLIFTGSVLGERPREGLTAYSASKAGLVGLAKGLALDLAPDRHHGERRGARAGSTRRWPTAGRATPSCRPPSPGTPRNAAGARPTDLAGAYQFLASDAVGVRHRHRAQRRRRVPARMTAPATGHRDHRCGRRARRGDHPAAGRRTRHRLSC